MPKLNTRIADMGGMDSDPNINLETKKTGSGSDRQENPDPDPSHERKTRMRIQQPGSDLMQSPFFRSFSATNKKPDPTFIYTGSATMLNIN